ncbi:hypothetical protein LguiA_021919 [Lonicera macranthoides]
MNEMWNNLPAEVFSEILSRFPLKTLLQCTSVCKSCVPNPSFVCEWHGHFGFGIDPVTIDYKIVRLAYLDKYRPPVVEPVELSTGSWRNIDAGDFGYIILPGAQQAFLNGVVHWTGYNPNKSGGTLHILIVSFDLRNELLGVVQVPPCVQEDRDHWFMRVTVFGERLAFLHSDGDRSWGLWVMKEYGVRDVYSGGWDLVSYDRKSKLIKNVDKFGTICSFNVDTYKESLVLVKGLNEVLGRKENSGGAATCEETSIMPKEENEVKEKRKI